MPELVQLAFECVSKICRDLCRQLSTDLPGALKATVGLRYSHASYVRGLAAQAIGLLFRHATNAAHKRGLMALFAGKTLCAIQHAVASVFASRLMLAGSS